MLNIKDRIRNYFQSMLPVKRATIVNPYAEQGALANRMDVDSVWEVIEAAKGGDPRDLFALYRDVIISHSHLQGEFGKRKLAALGDAITVQPIDKENADDVLAAKACQDLISNCPQWIRACSHLLDSALWPVAICEKVYRKSSTPGRAYDLVELVPVPDYLLTYVTNQQNATGQLKIRDTSEQGYILGTSKLCEPLRYITHRGHLLSQHDLFGGPMRSLLFWWLLSAMDRDWWSRFLERYGSPFLVGKYAQGDDASRSVLERAFSWAVKIGGLVVSKETEVEVQQAASAQTGEAYKQFIDLCNKEISKLIVGQVSSTGEHSSGGLNHSNKQQESVRDDIRQFDQVLLGETIRQQLFAQFLQINQIPGRVPKCVWGGESHDDAKQLAENLVSISRAGLEPTDEAIEAISDRLGFAVQRGPVAQSPFGGGNPDQILALSATPRFSLSIQDRIARAGAADLSRAFRGSLAPVRRLIAESTSAADLEHKLHLFYADFDPSRIQPLIEEALTAYAANGSASTGESKHSHFTNTCPKCGTVSSCRCTSKDKVQTSHTCLDCTLTLSKKTT